MKCKNFETSKVYVTQYMWSTKLKHIWYILWHVHRGIPNIERELDRLHAYLDEKFHALEDN